MEAEAQPSVGTVWGTNDAQDSRGELQVRHGFVEDGGMCKAETFRCLNSISVSLFEIKFSKERNLELTIFFFRIDKDEHLYVQ